MASASLREEITCSICLNVYTNPVTLRCGHNFCRECIDHELDTQKTSGVYKCPECRKKFSSRPSPVKNITLNNIVQPFHSTETGKSSQVLCTYCDVPSQAVKTCLRCETSMCERHLCAHNRSVQHILIDPGNPENTKCPIHKQILEFYCTEDSALLCATCGFQGEHQGHQVEPLYEALKKKKEKLGTFLHQVHLKIENTEKIIHNLHKDVEKIHVNANNTTEGINKLFQVLGTQLDVLKTNLVRDVSIKKEQASRSYTEQMQKLKAQTEELAKKKSHIEELCRDAHPFGVLLEQQPEVDDFPDCCAPIQSPADRDLGQISRSLQAHLAAIATGAIFWFYIQEPEHLLLDATTASKNLLIFPDQKTATYTGVNQNLQEMPQVLSTASFTSGKHYWDVETSDSGNWTVGICYPGIGRCGYNKKSWCFQRCNDRTEVRHNSQCIPLSVNTSCNIVRVYLDYEAGQLSFYKLGSIILHLHTFKATFTKSLHAVFAVNKGWLRIK